MKIQFNSIQLNRFSIELKCRHLHIIDAFNVIEIQSKKDAKIRENPSNKWQIVNEMVINFHKFQSK